MFEISNQSNWSAMTYPGWARNKEFNYFLVIKQSFEFNLRGQIRPLDKSLPIVTTDRYFTEPHQSALKQAHELAPFKKGGEIILNGAVYPHSPEATYTEARVTLRSNSINWTKSIVAFGTGMEKVSGGWR